MEERINIFRSGLRYSSLAIAMASAIYLTVSLLGLGGFITNILACALAGCAAGKIHFRAKKRSPTAAEAWSIVGHFAAMALVIDLASVYLIQPDLDPTARKWTIITLVTNQILAFALTIMWICQRSEK